MPTSPARSLLGDETMTAHDALMASVLWLADFTDEDVMDNSTAAEFFELLATYALDTAADLRRAGS